ncbi:MAG TPA: helix-turn-helix domain-containing protein [Chloroflexota bacterium]|nr:helix-turn-helix domain-containing protein [Chloroflexota bacterium]
MSGGGDVPAGLSELQRRVEALEAAVAAFQGQRTEGRGAQRTGPAARDEVGPVPELDPATAEVRLLEGMLPALQAVARQRQDRLLLVAVADATSWSGGSPQSVRALVEADLAGALARLGAAAGSGPRARLLQAMARGEERTTAELARASGASGGNLYQHLHALHGANLLYQPARGRYRLTANGQLAVELLLCAALQVRVSLPPDFGQGQWFAPEGPQGPQGPQGPAAPEATGSG